jgi:hypothetical protein
VTGSLFGFLMGFLRSAKSIGRMLQCLPGMLLSCLVIFLAVVGGGYSVGVRGQFMKLRRSAM